RGARSHGQVEDCRGGPGASLRRTSRAFSAGHARDQVPASRLRVPSPPVGHGAFSRNSTFSLADPFPPFDVMVALSVRCPTCGSWSGLTTRISNFCEVPALIEENLIVAPSPSVPCPTKEKYFGTEIEPDSSEPGSPSFLIVRV